MALPLRLRPHPCDGFAGWMNPDLTTVEHLDAADIESMSRTRTDDFCEAGYSDPHQLSLAAFLFLFFPQFLIPDLLQGKVHCSFVIAAVVTPPQGTLIRKVVCRNKILQTKLCWVHLQFLSQNIHCSFDQIRRFCHAERAPICDSSGRFIGVDTVHFAERFGEIVRTGTDAE